MLGDHGSRDLMLTNDAIGCNKGPIFIVICPNPYSNSICGFETSEALACLAVSMQKLLRMDDGE